MEESIYHLFSSFPLLQVFGIMLLGVMACFRCCQKIVWIIHQFKDLLCNGRTIVIRVRVVCFACIWSILKARNNNIFNNVVSIEQMLEYVKRMSWNWLNTKSKLLNCCLSQWYLNPKLILGYVGSGVYERPWLSIGVLHLLFAQNYAVFGDFIWSITITIDFI